MADLHSQVASIMEVLANAAVAEICKVVDDNYAVVHLGMARSQKENEVLKRKIKLLELQVARYRSEKLRVAESGSIGGRFPSVRILSRQSREPPTGRWNSLHRYNFTVLPVENVSEGAANEIQRNTVQRLNNCQQIIPSQMMEVIKSKTLV